MKLGIIELHDNYGFDIPNSYKQLIRCKECKYGEYREDVDGYECHSSGCGLVNDADFFCADGERREP